MAINELVQGHNYVVHCEILKLLGTFDNNHWMVCHAITIGNGAIKESLCRSVCLSVCLSLKFVRTITMSFIVGFLNDLVNLFTIMGRCVRRTNYFDISKVQVTLSSKVKNGHKWACPGHNYVVHCEILKSFGTFVHHHWTVCQCERIMHQYLQGQGYTLSLKVKKGHKWSCPGHNYVIHCEILKLLQYICKQSLDGVSCKRIKSISPRSKSHFEFKGKKWP